MKCAKCQIELHESSLDLSYDIPKYIGGTDLDGRHYLCKKHHKEYEIGVLKLLLKSIGETLQSDSFEEVLMWQLELKRNKQLHPKFKLIARKFCDEYFKND